MSRVFMVLKCSGRQTDEYDHPTLTSFNAFHGRKHTYLKVFFVLFVREVSKSKI
jgi:hypothetical protein